MKYLGIDFGLRRIGLALSEGNLASPLKVVEVKGFQDAVKKVIGLIKSEGFDKVVVGLPEGKSGQIVLGFINALRKQGLDVAEADETLSTRQAISQMIETNIPKRKRGSNDAHSAAIILQNYLDKQ